MTRKKINSIVKLIVKLGLTTGALIFVFKKIGIEEFHKQIGKPVRTVPQIMIDDKIFDEKNEIIIEAQKVTIDLKFVLIEKKTCDLIRELFLKKHITLKSIYCTSYIKSLEIIKKNQISGYVSFIDIGLKKSSLTIFQDSKLLYLNNTYIGGHHITNDIVKVLNLDYRKAEAEKFKFSKSNKCEDITINKSDDKMLRKIINARLEEIIELLFLNCPLINNFNFNSDLKLYFIGNGSKVLSENLLSFGPEFSFLKEMSIINETAKDSCDSALKYSNDEMELETAIEAAQIPIKDFMLRQTREKDLRTFVSISDNPDINQPMETPLTVLVPAFITSELKSAFTIGFMLYIPFIIIDMVVASVLMSMGMMMLSPMIISLPFKLLLFVMVDGWMLLMTSLTGSYV